MHEKYRYNLYSPTADYGIRPLFVCTDKQSPNPGFQSLYAVTEETAKAIQQEGTTKHFKGIVWSQYLWLDFDSYEAADRAEQRLKELGYGYNAYDTGGRGAHFRVDRIADPSHLLPARDKAFVQSTFPEADTSIYTHLHPFRIEGTIHDKTGLSKRLVCECRGSAVVLPRLKKENMLLSPGHTTGRRDKSIFDILRVMANTIPCRNGERHPTLIRLLYALRDSAQVDIKVAHFWVTEWNKMCQEPKPEEEIEKAIRSIYG